jgi:adenylate kinase
MKYQILMFGSQGAGKGTQSALLAEKLKANHVSMGALLREESKKKGKLGKEIAEVLKSGALVPYQITVKLIQQQLKKSKNGIIVDGFPRDLDQLREFDKFFKPTHIVFIKITEKETMRRLGGRWVCEKCGDNYHAVSKPPKKAGICDKCGGKLYQREDDKPAAIKKRLQIFKNSTLKVLNFYKKKYGIIEVKGSGKIDDVFKEILKKVK